MPERDESVSGIRERAEAMLSWPSPKRLTAQPRFLMGIGLAILDHADALRELARANRERPEL